MYFIKLYLESGFKGGECYGNKKNVWALLGISGRYGVLLVRTRKIGTVFLKLVRIPLHGAQINTM